MRTMEQHLDELGLNVAKARQNFDREQKEADAIQTLSHQRMAAAEALQNQANGETDPARKAAIEKSLTTLIDMMEKMAPDVERAVPARGGKPGILPHLVVIVQFSNARCDPMPLGPARGHKAVNGRSVTFRCNLGGTVPLTLGVLLPLLALVRVEPAVVGTHALAHFLPERVEVRPLGF
jgi:hypothetical protein